MSAYRGHLTTVTGDGPEVVIKLSGQTVRVRTPDGHVHTWPSQDVRVTGISGDRFWLAFEDEIAVFAPEEAQSFMLEFLPGLKAARTVAKTIAASELPTHGPSDRERQAWFASPAATTEDTDESPRPHVAARRPRLPQLAGHVEASLNDRAAATVTVDTDSDDAALVNRRWWSRGQTPPSLRPAPAAETPVEGISVDLTDATLDGTDDDLTISATVGRAEESGSQDDDSEASGNTTRSALLRNLASRNQAFQDGRRGTYRPKR